MCEMPDCNKPLRCKGLCSYHYQKKMAKYYRDNGGRAPQTARPQAKTSDRNREFYNGLWEFVKQELKING